MEILLPIFSIVVGTVYVALASSFEWAMVYLCTWAAVFHLLGIVAEKKL